MNKTLKQSIVLFLVLIIILINLLGTNLISALIGFVLPVYLIPIITFVFGITIWLMFVFSHNDSEETKNDFISIVMHKFRTPLTEIRWATETLKQTDSSIQDKDFALSQIDQARQKLSEIVDLIVGLVKFDNKMEYAFEATSFRELFDEALKKYSGRIREKNISFSIPKVQDIPLIIIDSKKIQFVIDTMLDNAIRYSHKEGQITTLIDQDPEKIIFKVSDNGIGIKSGDSEKIFSRFYRGANAKSADTEGVGISLHISRMIAEAHGGKLYVESEGLNKGSTFTLEIPKR